MKLLRNHFLVATFAAAVFAFAPRMFADRPSQFESIFQLVRTNLVGIDAKRFDRDALRSLLRRMNGQVELIKSGRSVESESGEVDTARVFDREYGYLRVSRVESGLAGAIRDGVREIAPDGGIRGLMVDLRFASGGDYEEAVRAANEFIDRDETQLVVGKQQFRTGLNPNAVSGPVAILVNSQTTGAAEALAGLMRHNDVGLLIGSRTGGQTKVFSRFALEDGSQLRVATGEVRLGDGNPVSREGILPDIEVRIDPATERRFFGDAYARPKGRKQRQNLLNEAELVRRLRLKLNPDAQVSDAGSGMEGAREVFDPVLGRALDILKGLNLLGPAK